MVDDLGCEQGVMGDVVPACAKLKGCEGDLGDLLGALSTGALIQ